MQMFIIDCNEMHMLPKDFNAIHAFDSEKCLNNFPDEVFIVFE